MSPLTQGLNYRSACDTAWGPFTLFKRVVIAEEGAATVHCLTTSIDQSIYLTLCDSVVCATY